MRPEVLLFPEQRGKVGDQRCAEVEPEHDYRHPNPSGWRKPVVQVVEVPYARAIAEVALTPPNLPDKSGPTIIGSVDMFTAAEDTLKPSV